MNLFQKLTSLTRRVVIVLALVGILGISFSAPAYAATPARFVWETPPASDQFVIELTDESKIQQARNILNGTQKDETHVLGRIIKRPAPYNPKWSYQLDPASISFFSFAIEVCGEHPSFAVSINAEGNYEQIDERIEIRDNTINRVDMTPEEQQKIKINLQEIAAIFYKNTPVEKLQDFESVELSQA